MKQHLTLMGSVDEISPVLALRSLFPWEGEYSPDDGELRTVHEGDTRSAIYAGEDTQPCVSATFTGDAVDIR